MSQCNSGITQALTMLDGWKTRCQNARNGHYEWSERFFFRSELLGYILIYSTVFVTAFSFFSLGKDARLFGLKIQYFVVLVGCVSAVISGIVTQSRYGERAEIHRSSAARYANLARDVELMEMKLRLGIYQNIDPDFKRDLDNFITGWSDLSVDSKLTPHKNRYKTYTIHGVIILFFIVLFFITASGEDLSMNNLLLLVKAL